VLPTSTGISLFVAYLGVHSAGVLKEGSPQSTLIDTKSLSNTRQIPYWLDSELGHGQLARRVGADLAIRHKPSTSYTLLELGKLHMGFGHGNGWPEVHCKIVRMRTSVTAGRTGMRHAVLRLHDIFEHPRDLVSPGVHSNDLLPVTPLGKGSDVDRGLGVGEIGPVLGTELVASYGQCIVDGIGAAMGADGVPSPYRRGCARDGNGTTLQRIRMAPFHRQRLDSNLLRVGG